MKHIDALLRHFVTCARCASAWRERLEGHWYCEEGRQLLEKVETGPADE